MRLCVDHLTLRDSCSYVVSSFLITFGIATILLRYRLFEFIKSQKMLLTPKSDIGTTWADFPYGGRDFYFFNWTNPEDIHNETVKPKFQEVGPYKFHEHRKKDYLVWNENGTVTYKQRRIWHYKDGDNGNLLDNITTVNAVALTSAHMHRKWGYLFRRGLSWLLSREASTVHITRTVHQMLFEGYSDGILSTGNSLPFGNRPPFDKFGWFYPRNGSEDYDGVYNVGTGSKSTMGELYRWNYLNETPLYRGDCASFGGSAGELFKLDTGKDSVRLFAPDVCKMVVLKYVGEREIGNLVGYKYTAEDRMLDNGTIYPENKCSCNGECLPSGVLNITSCKFGSPTFLSLPHFLNADPHYLGLVEGLRPDARKHELYGVVEPITGVPLETKVRIQINMLLQPVPGITMYEKIPKLLLPVLWFEDKTKLPHHFAFLIRLLINTPTVFMTIGSALILGGLILILYVFCRRRRTATQQTEKSCYLEETLPLSY